MAKTHEWRDGMGNIVVTSTQLYATFTDNGGNTYGYVTGVDIDGYASIDIVAARRADDQKPTCIKHSSNKQPLVTPCHTLFPVPREAANAIVSIDWEQPVWGEDGSIVASIKTLDTGDVLVTFVGMPYQWLYSVAGIPDDDYSWMPRLTNEPTDSALSINMCAKRDVYELRCTRNNIFADTWHNLGKREVVCLVAVGKLLARRARLDWTTDIIALSDAVIEATSGKTHTLNNEVVEYIRNQNAFDMAFGTRTEEFDYTIRYHYTDDISREVDLDDEIDEIVSIVADKLR